MNMEYTHFKKVVEAEEKGLVCTMNNIVERNRTYLNNALSGYFIDKMEQYNDSWDDEEEMDNIIGNINDFLSQSLSPNLQIQFPHYNLGSAVFIIPITQNLDLKILIVDEYYGDGDYAKYIMIDRFIINDRTTKKDVDKLIEFVEEYLTIKGDK